MHAIDSAKRSIPEKSGANHNRFAECPRRGEQPRRCIIKIQFNLNLVVITSLIFDLFVCSVIWVFALSLRPHVSAPAAIAAQPWIIIRGNVVGNTPTEQRGLMKTDSHIINFKLFRFPRNQELRSLDPRRAETRKDLFAFVDIFEAKCNAASASERRRGKGGMRKYEVECDGVGESLVCCQCAHRMRFRDPRRIFRSRAPLVC